MVFKADFAGSQRPLQEEPEWQLCKLSLDKSTDGLVSEGEDLLALLFPLVILAKMQMQQINTRVTKQKVTLGELAHQRSIFLVSEGQLVGSKDERREGVADPLVSTGTKVFPRCV